MDLRRQLRPPSAQRCAVLERLERLRLAVEHVQAVSDLELAPGSQVGLTVERLERLLVPRELDERDALALIGGAVGGRFGEDALAGSERRLVVLRFQRLVELVMGAHGRQRSACSRAWSAERRLARGGQLQRTPFFWAETGWGVNVARAGGYSTPSGPKTRPLSQKFWPAPL
eukprot:scaffold50882_cov61-Phaeocystis_antarctica.AAC.2